MTRLTDLFRSKSRVMQNVSAFGAKSRRGVSHSSGSTSEERQVSFWIAAPGPKLTMTMQLGTRRRSIFRSSLVSYQRHAHCRIGTEIVARCGILSTPDWKQYSPPLHRLVVHEDVGIQPGDLLELILLARLPIELLHLAMGVLGESLTGGENRSLGLQ